MKDFFVCSIILVLVMSMLTKKALSTNFEESTDKLAPVITVAPISQTHISKEHFLLYCKGKGPGTLNLKWLRGDKELKANDRYEIKTDKSINGEIQSSLWMYESRKKKKSIVFTCVVSNDYSKKDKKAATITLISEANKPNGFPEIVKVPVAKTVEKKRDDVIECEVRGGGDVTITWYKDKFLLQPIRNKIIIDSKRGFLEIQNSTETDEGKYYCMATNIFGSSISKGTNVYIKERKARCKITWAPEPVYDVEPGTALNLTCAAGGFPMPLVQWYKFSEKNGKTVREAIGERVQARPNILQLTDIQSSSNYTCFASSRSNNDSATTQIRLQTLPEIPTNVHVISSKSDEMTLSWSYDSETYSGRNTLTFNIYYRKKDLKAEDTEHVINRIQSTKYTIVGLSPFTEYSVRISATNKLGEGGKSEPSLRKDSYKTKEDSPSIPPSDLYGIVVTRMLPTDIRVFFNYPEEGNGANGIILGGRLYWLKVENENSIILPPLTEWSTKNLTTNVGNLQNLQTNSLYAIKVQVYNSAGFSPLTAPYMINTSFTIPAQPRNVKAVALSKNSVKLTWKKPKVPGNGFMGNITTYVVWSRCNDSKDESKLLTLSTDMLLGSLRPNTAYYLRVAARATNREETLDGVSSRPVKVVTQPAAPSGPPLEIQAVSETPHSLRVTWSPPKPDQINGHLVNYTIYFVRSDLNYDGEVIEGTAGNEQLVTIDGRLTTWIIENLRAYSGYTLEISASTQMGEGPKSEQVFVSTLETIPSGGPQNMTAIGVNETTIQVRWREVDPFLVNGPITGYEIVYRENNGGPSNVVLQAQNLKKENGYFFRNIGGLKMKTCYFYSMHAQTREGYGSMNAESNVCTKGKLPNAPKLLVHKEGTKAKLSWSAVEDSQSEVDEYISWHLKYKCDAPLMCGNNWIVHNFHASEFSFVPDDVYAGWGYNFTLQAKNSEGDGKTTTKFVILPPLKPSSAPTNFKARTVLLSKELVKSEKLGSPYGILLTWNSVEYRYSNGPVSSYNLIWMNAVQDGYTEGNTISCDKKEYLFKDVEQGERYQFQVSAVNEAGEGKKSAPLEVKVTLPPKVCPNISISNLEISQSSSNTTWLRWNEPETSSDEAISYVIKAITSANEILYEKETYSSNTKMTNLQPGLGYNFTVTIKQYESEDNLCQEKLTSWVQGRTTRKIAVPVPRVGFLLKEDVIHIDLNKPKQFDQLVEYYLIVVPCEDINCQLNFYPDSISQNDLMKASKILRKRKRRTIKESSSKLPYITARFSELKPSERIKFADGKNYGSIINKNVKPGYYKVFLRAILRDETVSKFISSPYSVVFEFISLTPQDKEIVTSFENNTINNITTDEIKGSGMTMWILIAVSTVLVLAVFISTYFLWKRRKSNNGRNNGYKNGYSDIEMKKNGVSSQMNQPLLNNRVERDPVELRRQTFASPEMTSRPPIVIENFYPHVMNLKANDNLMFSQEYQTIDPGQQFKWENSRLEHNKSKNRYANVVAYDHTRLTLSPIDGVPGSDYINANYISGFRKQNAYIATQGPLKNTIHDFWRMVWEQRCQLIVMMTKCEEKNKVKCDKYWPISQEASETYGNIKISLVEEIQLASFATRIFNVTKHGSNEVREIRHFQFTAWPDHAVPEHSTPVLSFVKRVKSSCLPEMGPIVVHCSAGVGRAGCFICIDAMLDRMNHENTVDVYGQVTCMRAERNYMVQSEDQYIFIHDALLEAITNGNTEIQARDLFQHLKLLTHAEDDMQVTGMETEFKGLSGPKATASCFVAANLPANKFKNRLVNILPFESSRVVLSSTAGFEGSDYINASFIDGYRQRHAYIATQGPLAVTTDDFWRMLWEHNSTIVVMLTKLREQGRDKCHQYWPIDRSARYQYFVVDPINTYEMREFTLREFKVTDARDGQSRTIRQFHFLDWPEQAVPRSGEGFIDFIGQVHKTKDQFGQEGPITVHCSAGVGRTGVFITLSIALERMRTESVVDMFQTVKTLRTQRPAMVQTEDQYQFCYRAALEYLGSFDHYTSPPHQN